MDAQEAGANPPNGRKDDAGLWQLINISAPLVVVSSSYALKGLSDSWMIGRLGTTELSAIATSGIWILVLASFGYGFFSIVTAMVAQAFGQGAPARCGELAWQGIVVAVLAGLAMLLLFGLLSRPLFELYGHAPRILAFEIAYFRVSLIALAAEFVAMAVANYFIGIQRPGIAMRITLISVPLNIVLSYGLLFGAFGLPELGLVGAAWGTLAANVIAVTILLGHLFLHPSAQVYRSNRLRVRGGDMATLVRTGLPAGLQSGLDTLSWGAVLMYFVGRFGEADLAAAAILVALMHVTFLPCEGIGAALVSLVGDAIGQNKPGRAESLARKAFLLMACHTVTCALIGLVFRHDIIRLFDSNPAVVAIGASGLLWLCAVQLFEAMQISALHALQGAGDTLWPSLANVGTSLLVLCLGGIVMVTFFPRYGSPGIWFLVAIYTTAQALLFWWRWRSGRWREHKILAPTIERTIEGV